MTKGKDPGSNQRKARESEIFRDPPGSGNYSSSIGAAHGIELFGGAGKVRRARPNKTVVESARQIPVFAETDVLVVGGGPAGTECTSHGGRGGRSRQADDRPARRFAHAGDAGEAQPRRVA
jgi:hypothetical protein